MTESGLDLTYDPYDFAVDADPYPIWRRLRDEQPLYRNEEHDFYAVSRYADVESCLLNWQDFISGRGSVLELIRSGMEIPRGVLLFEDPPVHDIHRGLLMRVLTPRRMAALEPMIRKFCADILDPLVGSTGFDFVRDLGAVVPMQVISEMLGIPQDDRVAVRDQIDAAMKIEDGEARQNDADSLPIGGFVSPELIAYRRKHPSDDLLSALVTVTFEDENGVNRPLEEDEVFNYSGILAAAGNETTTKLIGWAGSLLAQHPDQRQQLVDDPTLIPRAVEEILRYEAPSPVQARYVTKDVDFYDSTVPEGSVLLLLNGSGNRDDRKFEEPDRFDISRKSERHLSFGYGIHFCMGAALARLEGRIVLEEVLARFPKWEVDHDNCERVHTSTVRGWERLPVVL